MLMWRVSCVYKSEEYGSICVHRDQWYSREHAMQYAEILREDERGKVDRVIIESVEVPD